MQADRLDLRILRSLNRDGRKPYKTIAEELDVSDATIRKRVKRMQKEGIIKQFHVTTNHRKQFREQHGRPGDVSDHWYT
jgi:Lrp/AsnC family transcriptional regulator for asnA, asnC and gidA